jgi:hypothetical protein
MRAYPDHPGRAGRGVASMVEGDLGRHRVVIVVAAAHDALATETARLAAEYELEVQRCDDVYAAVAELALSQDRCVLVVGRLGELAKEDRRFFAIAARSGARCCGLLEAVTPIEPNVVPTAIHTGVFLVGTTGEIKGVFDAWLSARGGCPSSEATICLDEEYRATEAELNALLGQEIDE